MRTLPPRTTPQPDSPAPRVEPATPVAVPVTSAGQASARWPGQDLLDDPVLAGVLFSVWAGDTVSVVDAPPGAGKTRAVTLIAAALAHKAGLRVLVAAQTRAQAYELAARLGAVSDRCALIVKARTVVPPNLGKCRVVSGRSVRWRSRAGGEILIATTARWMYGDPAALAADVVVCDEAYQCTYADLGALAAFASQIVAVGDPGQIAPVVTGDTDRWSDDPSGPQVAAPLALRAAYPDAVGVHRLRSSWRLGPRTCALLSQVFYRDMPFGSMRPGEAVAVDGHPLPEIAHRVTAVAGGPTDHALLGGVAARVRELLARASYTTASGTRAVTAGDIGVVVPHVTQSGAVRALLADEPEVLVGTANAMQGIERPVIVAVHPLAGYRSVEPFPLDAGRLCVTLSRHRAHLSVFTDAATPALLGEYPDADAAAVFTAVAATPAF